jgi:hypothetical protein
VDVSNSFPMLYMKSIEAVTTAARMRIIIKIKSP